MCMYGIQVSHSRYWHSLYDQEHKKVKECESSLSALRVQMKQKDEQIDELKKVGNHWLDMWTKAKDKIAELQDQIKALKDREPFDRDHYIKQIDELALAAMGHTSECIEYERNIEALGAENDKLQKNREAQIAHINDLQNVISRRNQIIAEDGYYVQRSKELEADRDELKKQISVQDANRIELIRQYDARVKEKNELKKRVEELEAKQESFDWKTAGLEVKQLLRDIYAIADDMPNR